MPTLDTGGATIRTQRHSLTEAVANAHVALGALMEVLRNEDETSPFRGSYAGLHLAVKAVALRLLRQMGEDDGDG